jgi:hypothetical protein
VPSPPQVGADAAATIEYAWNTQCCLAFGYISAAPRETHIEDYDRIRDVMAKGFDGFEEFNRRGRLPLGFSDPPARARAAVPHPVENSGVLSGAAAHGNRCMPLPYQS